MSVPVLLQQLREANIKIWAEGDKLRYRTASGGFPPDLRHAVTEQKAEILAFLQQAVINTPLSEPITPVERLDDLPLSFAEERLWFIQQLEPDAPIYNLAQAYHLTGRLNKQALEKSIEQLIARHESLRTTFRTENGQPRRVIAAPPPFQLPISDLSHLSEVAQSNPVQDYVSAEAVKLFDLEKGPLFRVECLQLAAEAHVLLMTMHHIISDGWSLEILHRELSILYEAHSRQEVANLPELSIQYADFAHWQRLRQADILSYQLRYWLHRLQDIPPLTTLPTDHPRPEQLSYRGTRFTCKLPAALTEDLRDFGQQANVTLFMTLLAAFQVLIYRYSGQKDIVIGSPIANRTNSQMEAVIGFFVNTLVLRTKLSDNLSFTDLLAQVRTATLEDFQHQDLSFGQLVEALQPVRTLKYPPLVQIVFALQNHAEQPFSLPGVIINHFPKSLQIARFELGLAMQERDGTLHALFNYNCDLFEEDTIKRMAGHFQTLLEGIIAHPSQPIASLPILTESERHQLLVEWNNTGTQYPKDLCVHQIFEAQAEQTPNAIAVVFNGEQLSYKALNTRANELAHRLIDLGIEPEARVGICIERSLEMVIGILAILKAGGVYVPLDANYPTERLNFMLADSEISALLVHSHLQDDLPSTDLPTIVIAQAQDYSNQDIVTNPKVGISSENLAYIMYTSGSTGRPKGVMIEHRSIVKLVKNIDYATLTPSDVFVQLIPLVGDGSTFEIWGALLNGAKLVVAVPGPPSLAELGDLIKRYHISVILLTAGLFHLLIDEQLDALKNVALILAGGDVLSIAHVRKLQAVYSGTLLNGYGPTENTTTTSCYLITPETQFGASIPIGRPISNTQIYILDDHLQPVPIGIPGTLYIGGDGLARGYLNRPKLNKERFIPNPFQSGTRLYNSGDQARYLYDGNIEFLGRKDTQVKIRGFRIELGEIEVALHDHPAVRDAVVVLKSDFEDKYLVAYIVANQAISDTQLRHFLSEKLPDYMVPSVYVQLEAFPLMPNNKVDRRRLPEPDMSQSRLEGQFIAPNTPTEIELANIWGDILSASQISLHDNFFEIGGHSLKAIQIVSRIRQAFQVDLPLRLLFQTPTIARIAEYIDHPPQDQNSANRTKASSLTEPFASLVPIKPDGRKLPLFLLPGGGGSEWEYLLYAQLIHLLGTDQPVYGFYARGLQDEQPPHTDVATMAADYIKEMRTIQPQGPYLLGGECTGGKVAFEMARQLQVQGQTVADLLLLNTALLPKGVNILQQTQRKLRYKQHIRRVQHHANQLKSLSFQQRLGYFVNKIPTLPFWPFPLTSQQQKARQARFIRINYMQTLQNYRPQQRYSGTVNLLVSQDDYRADVFTEWTRWVDQALEIQPVPGIRQTYLGGHVETTAGYLRQILDKPQSNERLK